MLLVWSLVMMTWYLHSPFHMASDSTLRPTSSVWRSQYWPRSRGQLLEDPTSGKQDSAACHTSWRTLCWLWENFCDHITPNIWPPYSLNCSPLQYYMWGAIEWETHEIRCSSKDEIKAKITAAFVNFNKETVGKTYIRVQSYLEAVVEANGDFFE